MPRHSKLDKRAGERKPVMQYSIIPQDVQAACLCRLKGKHRVINSIT